MTWITCMTLTAVSRSIIGSLHKIFSFVDLGPWISSIKNQLWWSFHNSIGNLEMLKEKLNSVTDHLSNIHHFPDNKHYEKCEHGNLEKAWLHPESLVMIGYSLNKLAFICFCRQLLRSGMLFTGIRMWGLMIWNTWQSLHTQEILVRQRFVVYRLPQELSFQKIITPSETSIAVKDINTGNKFK